MTDFIVVKSAGGTVLQVPSPIWLPNWLNLTGLLLVEYSIVILGTGLTGSPNTLIISAVTIAVG